MSERTDHRRNDKIYPDLAVAVLAGGKSSRYGADKALIRLFPGGPTLIEQIVSKALELSQNVAVIGHERYAALNLDVPIFQDEEVGRGPLAGIATAMRRLDRPRLLVLACDMPCLSLPLLRWMIERPTESDVVIPCAADGRWQTMHAIYQRSALPEIEQSLSIGKSAVRSILPSLVVDAIEEHELRAIDPELRSLFSLNRPEDLANAMSCVEGR